MSETHRVTLELTGRFDTHPSTWPWESIFNCDIRARLEPGDSVRVVDFASPELRKALENALRLQWPHTAEQMKILTRCTGPSCVVPENHYKAAIRAFLEATK